MIIRASHLSDTPAIVQLLKESLGESLLKKTTDIWLYKHEQNPFGPSYVLLAEEASHLIGVRAFMQWRWQKGSEVLQAYRAVDTATHPQHQGRGIFKKLTKAGIMRNPPPAPIRPVIIPVITPWITTKCWSRTGSAIRMHGLTEMWPASLEPPTKTI